jgi:hypothetical protein
MDIPIRMAMETVAAMVRTKAVMAMVMSRAMVVTVTASSMDTPPDKKAVNRFSKSM